MTEVEVEKKRAVRHLIVLVKESKFRINYGDDSVTLSEIVNDALTDFLVYHDGMEEVSSARVMPAVP